MKKLFLILLILLLVTKMSYSQCTDCCCKNETGVACADDTDDYITPSNIILDFKTKNIAFEKHCYRLKRGDAVRVKVVNYNPFLYNVIINSKDSSVNPMVDNGNVLSWFLNPSDLSSIVGGISSSVTAAAAAPTPSAIGTAPPTSPQSGKNTRPNPKVNPSQKPPQVALPVSFLRTQMNRTDTLQKRIDSLKSLIDSKFYKWSRLFRVKLIPNIKNCADFHVPDSTDTRRIEDTFSIIKTAITKVNNTLKTDLEKYMDSIGVIDTYAQAIKTNKLDSMFNKDVNQFYSTAIKYVTKMDSVTTYKNLLTVVETIDAMQGEKSCFTSLPIFLTTSLKTISIQIKPWKDSTISQGSVQGPLQGYSTSFQLPWTQRQVFGVSAGVYVDTHNNGIYNAVQTAGDTTYTLVENSPEKLEIGIDALAYTGWNLIRSRKTGALYFGPCLGAAMSIQSQPEPRILFGATLIIGDGNRLLISTGFSVGQVQELENGYNTYSTYITQPSNYETSVTQWRPFLSLNYSFIGN